MSVDEKRIFFVGVLVTPIMSALFNLYSYFLEFKALYFVSLSTYWLFLYLSILLKSKMQFFDKTLYNANGSLVDIIYIFPLIGVISTVFIPSSNSLSLRICVMAIVTSVINGVLEERFWRGFNLEFLKRYKCLGFIYSVILFGIWHIPLYFLKGVYYHGGFTTMVGSSFLLGGIWYYTSKKSNNIFLTTIAHIIINFFAFAPHYIENNF